MPGRASQAQTGGGCIEHEVLIESNFRAPSHQMHSCALTPSLGITTLFTTTPCWPNAIKLGEGALPRFTGAGSCPLTAINEELIWLPFATPSILMAQPIQICFVNKTSSFAVHLWCIYPQASSHSSIRVLFFSRWLSLWYLCLGSEIKITNLQPPPERHMSDLFSHSEKYEWLGAVV